MIIITGATGRLGGLIVERLLQRVPATEVGVSVRDPGKAQHLKVRVRRGDFTEPATLAHAFEGATTVLVVSASIRGEGAVAANIAAIDAAVAAGASRVIYTSHQAASPTSLFAPQLTHAATEAHLAKQNIPFTALRNGFYASTIALHLTGARETGRLVLPEDGPVSWTDHADLAEAAAVAATDSGVLNGVTPPLTAPEALDFSAISHLLGLERVVVSDEEWAAAAVGRGMPPAAAEFTLGMFRAARRGEFAATDPTLEKVVGHPPTSVRAVLDKATTR